MPIPSDNLPGGDWGARPTGPKRSVFPNYAATADAEESEPQDDGVRTTVPAAATAEPSAEAARALARSFVYRVLAAAFADPDADTWHWLASAETGTAWANAWTQVGEGTGPVPAFREEEFEAFRDAYAAVFGHAARGPCPINEIEYGEPHADPLYQPQRLADLAGFYRAFGMELAEQADERPDHLSVELEFLCVLTAKEAWAWSQQPPGEGTTICRDAQRKFLREYLGRWAPAFARRLAGLAAHPTLQALAGCLAAFVTAECRRLGVEPGPAHLGLRPVDDALERLCDSCGLASALPGAVRPPA
ncbi:TorD/DmsD family molecular chaperone [Limisphaera sp. VF-2]|uniref:TorD/DmsD family molecular chaperone n=1 Tax=Limisphaera sp. VF-2 TaxID=3400418 RepID=UPI003C28C04A